MILSKIIKTKVVGRTLKYYINLGYNVKVNDIIRVSIKHLQKGSNVKIKVKCDICGKKRYLVYQMYLKNIKNYNIYTCNGKCSQIKNKKTCLKIYGVEHSFQSENNKIKATKTSLAKYGTKHPFQNKKVQEKYKQTILKKYGVNWPTQNKEISKKSIETLTGMPYNTYIKKLPEYQKYRKEVSNITNKQSVYVLKYYNKKGPTGRKGTYSLDHKYSIKQGFIGKIDPQIIGNIINLEFIPWEDNLKKHWKCSITKEELFNLYNNKDKILEHLTEEYNKRQKYLLK